MWFKIRSNGTEFVKLRMRKTRKMAAKIYVFFMSRKLRIYQVIIVK